MSLDLIKSLKSAKVRKVKPDTPEIIKLIVNSTDERVLNRLSAKSKSLEGRGGNTNFGENVVMESFLKIKKSIAHPNGSQKPPDILLAGKYKVELKSIKDKNGKFAFNDSLPDPFIYYCFYVRKQKRMLALKGDILLVSLDSERASMLFTKMTDVRKLGSTRKGKALEYYYPRQNLFIRNFLEAVDVNGFYDFDNNTIWVAK